jgi:trimethylamine--corrinoid protein Co-methyltransferase
VLYGAVPVRTRLDNMNDKYGAPEVNHYTHDCSQMARFYGLPCYSTAGVGDEEQPGIQATVEKMLTLMSVPQSGPQYVHYAFGLLERTNVFCPEQAILDDAQIGLAKDTLRECSIAEADRRETVELIRQVMETDHRTYMYHLPLPTRDSVYAVYPLEHSEGGALRGAHERYREIQELPRKPIADDVAGDIQKNVPGVLDKTLSV